MSLLYSTPAAIAIDTQPAAFPSTGISMPDFDISKISADHPGTTAQRLQRYEIFWIREGEGWLQVDGQDYALNPHKLFCIAPGHWRQLFVAHNVEGYYISFSPDFLNTNSRWADDDEDLFAQLQVLDASGYLQAELEILMRKMMREYHHFYQGKTELLKGLVRIFMIYFGRQAGPASASVNDSRETTLFRQFARLVRTNFMEKKMVSDYADILCVTANHLNRTIKKITGYTASHHIQQQVIREAKRMAIYSETSMKEIAYSLGFDNLAHFSKFFKNNSGMSFSCFRRSRPVA